MKTRLALLASALAFALAACGDNEPAAYQPQTATAAPHKADPAPVAKRESRRSDGPVYDGETY